ncbi:hypothetical protein CLV84_3300 [Neolewinella xylanilytica]|uniref:Uncharacterized protein n=1 Tax=Neolewinella xylanilytica TaxID=1514080 RepID=A0A2S6I5C2_9BACT|nr:hypothetical protein [Neolewinella xylanilytica]PPK86374.1 hypothetical protein CLV84_3300 [Neolewinella xylanilytica]
MNDIRDETRRLVKVANADFLALPVGALAGWIDRATGRQKSLTTWEGGCIPTTR